MSDTDAFPDQDIFAMTLIGESESLGEQAMTAQASSIMNRVKANIGWMGASNARNVCLARNQYDVWWPATDNADRQRCLDIAQNNRAYPPFVVALGIAATALAGDLVDCVNGGVSYFDGDNTPYWAIGKTPCFVNGTRQYYDLAAVT
jgi:hypothetical protein